MPSIEQARTWYTDDDPVHDFAHIMRVYHMAERIGIAEGANLDILRAAALLHDAEGSTSGSDTRASHHHSSAEFAAQVLAQEGWPSERIAAVQHCIRAHRFRGDGETPQTLEARILFDADKLDVIGAIGVARVIAYATLNQQPVFFSPSQKFLEHGELEPGEPHSAYHEYIFKLRKIKDRLNTPSARAMAAERDQYISDYFLRLQLELKGER